MKLKISKIHIIIVLIAMSLLLLIADAALIFMKNKSAAEYKEVQAQIEEFELEEKIEYIGKKGVNNDKDDLERRGTSRDVPEDIRTAMIGVSMPETGGTDFSNLKYLTIPYYDFKGTIRAGHMIVDKDLAEEVLDIFAELFDIQYPIERMELPENFSDSLTNILPSVELASAGNNNTSCFFDNGETQSKHARGRAIDLNPKINPWVYEDGSVRPQNAKKYSDRIQNGWTAAEKSAAVSNESEVYDIFTRRGWKWGGDWDGDKDYGYFYK